MELHSFSNFNAYITFLVLLVWFNSNAQKLSKYIVVDQFGYQVDSKKIAVIRDPQTGSDAGEAFTPGTNYAVVNKKNGKTVLIGIPKIWNNGATDFFSGDKIWWFDFSALKTVGSYYIKDISNKVKSFDFEISNSVYSNLLMQAVRTFYYQRAGFEKTENFAGKGYADKASFIGPLQDANCRPYNDPENSNAEKDLHGGWFDAGDLNRYTNWEANYIVSFMHTYLQNPMVWSDDYNIPESGNKIPDLLDEAKWGLEHLLRLQNTDGSVISIVSIDDHNASPPSNAKGRSLYGTPSTTSTLSSAGAYALAAKVYHSIGLNDFANQLKIAAIKSWDWAEKNPAIIFKNNDAASGTNGLGAGQQEVDDYGRFILKMRAACFLFEMTGEEKYKTYFENNYKQMHLILFGAVSQYNIDENKTLLYYAKLEGVNTAVANEINDKYKLAMASSPNYFKAYSDKKDAYLSYCNYYGWGSNSIKSSIGILYTDLIYYDIDKTKNNLAREIAENYLHYIHGINPLNLVYLSNMKEYGAENSVSQFYHTWFTNGSSLWDQVGVSTYGPPPGFLTGGPNKDYKWDSKACPANPICTSETIPKNEPQMKFYKDINTSWPLNTWEITENSCAYQINYIQLLSNYVSLASELEVNKK